MKKFVLIFLTLAGIGSVALGFKLVDPWLPKKAYPVEAVLPEGPLAFVSMKNLEQSVQKFAATQLWQSIQSLEYEKFLAAAGVKAEEIVIYKALREQLLSPDNQKILGNFFGQEIAVAVYPMPLKDLTPAAIQEAAGSVFFVTRLKPEAQFAEFVTGLLGRFSPEVQIQPVKYKNHTIMLATGKGESLTIGYVSFNNLLVFGVGDKAAKTCIDVVTKSQKSLNDDKVYGKAKAAFLPEADAVSFANFDSFVSLLKNQVLKQSANDPKSEVFQQQFDRTFRQMQGFQSLGYSAAYGNMIDLKVDVHFDKAKLDPLTAQIYNCPPGENRSLAFIPQSVIGYQWNNCYNLKLYWQEMQNEIAEAAKLAGPGEGAPANMVAGIEQSVGLSIENDIIPAFGDEVGGALADFKISESFPIPQLLLFIEAANQEKVDQVLNVLLGKQPMIQPVTENYQDVTIKYVTLPLLVVNLEPAFAYIDNYLVLSTDRPLLKQAIDTQKKAAGSVLDHPKLKEIDFDLTGGSNAAFFLDLEQLMQKMTVVVDWGIQWVSAEDTKREAFKAGSEKRLTDLKAEMEIQKTELDTLYGQLHEQKDAPVSDSTGPQDPGATAQIEEQIAKKEQDLMTNEEKAVELEYVIGQYTQPANTQSDIKVIREFVQPLFKALEFSRVLASTTQIKEGLIETKVRLNVK